VNYKKIILLILIISCLLLNGCSENKFTLETKYYTTSTTNELESKNFNQLLTNKESFAIFIYQPLCAASDAFEVVINDFVSKYQISFYKMSFANMKNTSLNEVIKYYPSLVIYHDGKLVDYLDANSEKDAKYYKSVDKFTEWFASYVKINQNEFSNENNSTSNNENQNSGKIDVKLENIKYDENKVNIYFFWGNGCPHCEAEHHFFEEIATEYGDYYTLNTFEVWYNEDNLDILKQFSQKMGDEVKGVPYTIIGNETFSGFGEKIKEQIKTAIKTQSKNSYDVYFANKD